MGLLDGMMQQPQQQPQGGLLGAYSQPAQASAGGARQLPPEVMQAVQQVAGASPEQKQAFIAHIAQVVQQSPKDDASKQQFMQLLTQAVAAA